MQKLYLLLGILILAACQTERESAPPPQPPTAQEQIVVATLPPPTSPPLIVTRTPRPTAEPTITATANEALLPYAGTWTLFLRYELSNSDLLPVQKAIYSASADLTFGIEGTVFGVGSFSPSFQSADCLVRSVATEGLEFRLAGSLEPSEDGARLNLTVIPNDPSFAEEYEISCADPLDSTKQILSKWDQALIFPLLEAANQSQLRLNLSGFSLRVEPQIIDLSTLANAYTGELRVEVYLSR